MRNLFPDGAETSDTNKKAGELQSTGYSPAKKKGGRLVQGAGCGRLPRRDGISPCDTSNMCKDDQVDTSNGD